MPEPFPIAHKTLPPDFDVLAPDGSEIRVLLSNRHASTAHGTLPPGGVTFAVTHRTVEEIRFILGGKAELWQKRDQREEVVQLRAGDSVTIPLRTHFQFRTVGDRPFEFLMCTTPPWPGEDEAIRVNDYWEPVATVKT